MTFCLISPRLAVQKRDFLGSGIPYWPLELAILASHLRNQGHTLRVLDLFGSAPNHLTPHETFYLQGVPLQDFITEHDLQSDLFIVYATSYMSHLEIQGIVRFLKMRKPNSKVAVLENSQAVTAYSLSQVQNDFWAIGTDYLFLGAFYYFPVP
jgi:hypothetical protein